MILSSGFPLEQHFEQIKTLQSHGLTFLDGDICIKVKILKWKMVKTASESALYVLDNVSKIPSKFVWQFTVLKTINLRR